MLRCRKEAYDSLPLFEVKSTNEHISRSRISLEKINSSIIYILLRKCLVLIKKKKNMCSIFLLCDGCYWLEPDVANLGLGFQGF